MAAGRRRRQAARLPVVTPSLTRSPAVSNPTEVIAARLSDLLDSIKCRPVLARLKAQGYSEQVAQVDAAWAGQGVNANPAAMAWRGPIMPLLFFFFQRACLEVHAAKRQVSYESALKYIKRHDVVSLDRCQIPAACGCCCCWVCCLLLLVCLLLLPGPLPALMDGGWLDRSATESLCSLRCGWRCWQRWLTLGYLACTSPPAGRLSRSSCCVICRRLWCHLW